MFCAARVPSYLSALIGIRLDELVLVIRASDMDNTGRTSLPELEYLQAPAPHFIQKIL